MGVTWRVSDCEELLGYLMGIYVEIRLTSLCIDGWASVPSNPLTHVQAVPASQSNRCTKPHQLPDLHTTQYALK